MVSEPPCLFFKGLCIWSAEHKVPSLSLCSNSNLNIQKSLPPIRQLFDKCWNGFRLSENWWFYLLYLWNTNNHFRKIELKKLFSMVSLYWTLVSWPRLSWTSRAILIKDFRRQMWVVEETWLSALCSLVAVCWANYIDKFQSLQNLLFFQEKDTKCFC